MSRKHRPPLARPSRAPAKAGAQLQPSRAQPSRAQPLRSPAKAGAQLQPLRALALLLALSLATPAQADSSLPPAHYSYTQLENPKQEAEAKALMESLRCLVCQGQSIADSDAEMAGDMRAFVRERVRNGTPPERIRAWLVQRYGAWVSYKPPVEPLTWPLWAAPAILLLAGLWLASRRIKRRAR